ncbi:MAG: aldose epimerase family protein [Pirellulaceae bacterium]
MTWSFLMSRQLNAAGLGIRQFALLALLLSIANHSCFGANQNSMSIEKSVFGKTSDGTEVHLYKCTNAQGASMSLTEYGAIMVSVEMPDRNGKLENITLGFDKLEGYLQRHPYFGATVGRYANRIAKGKFTLNGQQYTLATNNGPNHLHGGQDGFDRQVWQAEEVSGGSEVGVKFTRTSPDGEEGYPGNLNVTVIYTLNNDNEIKMVMSATTDQATVLNLTNHNYWNLGGANSGSILDHQLMIASDKFLAVDDTLIPTGEMTPVPGTPLDFTSFHAIGERIKQIDADPVGYDHCFVLRSNDGSLQTAAKVKDAKSGRVMEVLTDQPGIQFYSGNFLDGSEGGNGHKQYDAFCLETQRFPDSPNQPDFPTTVLKPGGKFQQTTVHRFTVE